MKKILLIASFFFYNCLFSQDKTEIIVLGTVQDGGLPHINCSSSCCFNKSKSSNYKVSSLGLVDSSNKKFYIFDATPDFPSQFNYMKNRYNYDFNGIFLTHAHIGHYSGLMFLGKEAMNSDLVPVFTLPRMYSFLNKNSPWSQLINQSNIIVNKIFNGKSHHISKNLAIKPLLVPHRDEFSETVGYLIQGLNKKILFIPDIDKWSKWEFSLKDIIDELDLLFIDGTFYDNSEISYRPIDEIPHPFVSETMKYLDNLSLTNKNKIYFIHMNHTNPMLDPQSKITLKVLSNGFNIAKIGQTFEL
jgi:pyrroloquinoline quinone biosynthesis protein B